MTREHSAVAAGLIVKEEHFSVDQASHQENQSVESIIAPFEDIFANEYVSGR